MTTSAPSAGRPPPAEFIRLIDRVGRALQMAAPPGVGVLVAGYEVAGDEWIMAEVTPFTPAELAAQLRRLADKLEREG